MRVMTSLVLSLFMSFAGLASQTQEPLREPADYVIFGGPIYTLEPDAPIVEAVAVRGARIIYVGSRDGLGEFMGTETRSYDLAGSALYPGFVDAHAHLLGIGLRELTLNLDTVDSIESLKAAVHTYAANTGDDVITGRGWIETHWPEGRFPTRWDLDAVVSDRPVLLMRSDGHAIVANSRALALADINSDTQAPFGGEIIKNALGEPTGILVDAAMSLTDSLQPAMDEKRMAGALIKAGEVYSAQGWTGLHNMSVSWQQMLLAEQLSDAGQLPLRVYNALDLQEASGLLANGHRTNTNGHVITRAIKMYVDGALGSRGAALLEPYSDADTSGLMTAREQDVKVALAQALRLGIQMNVHAIGDRANRLLLDWYGQTFEAVPEWERAITDPRWRIEHAQIVNPADLGRFAALGVIPSMQPSHAIGDLHFAADRLGDDRLRGAYAWASLIATGVPVAGGSDAPVEKGSPLIEFYAATARTDLNGFQGENWHAQEAVSREDALKMFTLWPAFASFAEDRLGSIRTGKQADFTAFSQDLMTVPLDQIMSAEATLTVIAGKVVHNRLAGGTDR